MCWALDVAELGVVGCHGGVDAGVEGDFEELAVLVPVDVGVEGKVRADGRKLNLLGQGGDAADLHLPLQFDHERATLNHFHLCHGGGAVL